MEHEQFFREILKESFLSARNAKADFSEGLCIGGAIEAKYIFTMLDLGCSEKYECLYNLYRYIYFASPAPVLAESSARKRGLIK